MATYGNITHLYAVTRQQGTGTWAAESVQFGLRFGLCFGDAVPALSDGIVTLDTHSVDTDGGQEEFTNYVVNWGFSETSGSLMLSRAFQLAVANQVLGFLGDTAIVRSQQYQFADLRLYPVLQDGKIPTGLMPTIISRKTAAFDGIAGQQLLDPANAIVASLYSANRTKQGRGRIYIGPFSVNAVTNGRVAPSTVDNVRVSLANRLSDIRAIGDAAGEPAAFPIVWRRGTLQAAVVDRVRVNDIWDNQSRRTKGIPAVWTSTALT